MKQTVIIVEGPDMTGKSEIAKELSRRFNIPYFKASSERANFLNDRTQFIDELRFADPRTLDILKQTKMSMVFDRAYPSEWVYSKVLNRQTDDVMLKNLDEGYASLDAWIIVCTRSSYAGIIDDIDPVTLNSNRLAELDDQYKCFTRWSTCKRMLLNVDDENIKREVSDVLFAMGLGNYYD